MTFLYTSRGRHTRCALVTGVQTCALPIFGKRLGLPQRLVTILEGEGLVNDATALVMLRSSVAAIAGAISFWGAIGDFAYAVVGAIFLGRSEQRRVGKEWVSRCRSRWAADHYKKNNNIALYLYLHYE